MKKILLVIDIQKGFIVNNMTEEASCRIDSLLTGGLFDVTVASRYMNYPDSPIIRLMGWDKLSDKNEQTIVGNSGQCVKIIDKKKYSAVTPELLEFLNEQYGGVYPEAVFLAGVDTECCVLSTAVDLFELGIRPVVLSHYCGSSGGTQYHQAGILSLYHLIGQNNVYDGKISEEADIKAALDRTADTELNCRIVTPREEELVSWLKKNKKRISFAESCTGGMAAARLVNVPSASDVFDSSVVTYANEAKMKYLGVRKETIAHYGVVSEEVVGEMALGAAENNNAQIGVGISGIAGPGGATSGKPVGMVCFGFAVDGKVTTRTVQFGAPGRNIVRRSAVDFAFDTLLALLKSKN